MKRQHIIPVSPWRQITASDPVPGTIKQADEDLRGEVNALGEGVCVWCGGHGKEGKEGCDADGQ